MKKTICDYCGKSSKNELEAQEFVNIKHNCGYNSIFIDGGNFDIDLCQNCFKELVYDKIFLKDKI
jgi:hypothetical protein